MIHIIRNLASVIFCGNQKFLSLSKKKMMQKILVLVRVGIEPTTFSIQHCHIYNPQSVSSPAADCQGH
jgi:hypothetical protein